MPRFAYQNSARLPKSTGGFLPLCESVAQTVSLRRGLRNGQGRAKVLVTNKGDWPDVEDSG